MSNPFSPPVESPPVPEAADHDLPIGVWRDGDSLVIAHGTRLPPRCVVCNEPSVAWVYRRMRWHSAAVYGLVLLSPLVYAVAARMAARNVQCGIGLCERHQQRRWGTIAAAWLAPVLGVGAIWLGGVVDVGALGVLGVFVVLSPFVTVPLAANVVRVTHIEGNCAWTRGAGEAFLASLEPYDGKNLVYTDDDLAL